MSYYEYKTVPAPADAPRLRGVKGMAARYAEGLTALLNEYGAAGWEFQRTENLTATARTGLLQRARHETVTVMVFRRWVETEDVAMAPVPYDAPDYEPQGPRLTAERPYRGRSRER